MAPPYGADGDIGATVVVVRARQLQSRQLAVHNPAPLCLGPILPVRLAGVLDGGTSAALGVVLNDQQTAPSTGNRRSKSASRVPGGGISGRGDADYDVCTPEPFFPLVWVGPFLVFDGLVGYGRGRSLALELRRGEWRLAVAVGLVGLMCGFLWEFWNFWSMPKWIYHIAYVEFLHVFEMPLIGYLGYIPFAWSVYQLLQLRPIRHIPGAPDSARLSVVPRLSVDTTSARVYHPSHGLLTRSGVP